jgi:hypothetical protein
MISNGPKRSDLGRYIDRIPNKPAGFSMDPIAFRTSRVASHAHDSSDVVKLAIDIAGHDTVAASLVEI